MKQSATDRVKEFLAPRLAVKLLLVSLGLTASAFAQNPVAVSLWRQWMVLPEVTGPRLYLITDRNVLQTSSDKAQFQNGSYAFMLADGGVPDIDRDLDSHTDGQELSAGLHGPPEPTEAFDVGPSRINDKEDVPKGFVTFDSVQVLKELSFDAKILVNLGDNTPLRLADSTRAALDARASLVNPYSGNSVRIIAAPADSKLVSPAPLKDYSTQFYFTNPNSGFSDLFRLSLYYQEKVFANPGDANSLETAITPGSYQIEFPTISNPVLRSGVWTAHRLVPNGSLTIGKKKPTWLVRSLSTIERFDRPPVPQSWVNGRLKFDPNLDTSITWDNLIGNGLASTADRISLWVEDELGSLIWSPIALNIAQPTATIRFGELYGSIEEHLGNSFSTLSKNGFIVMRYSRDSNGASNANLATVTVRVPVQMAVSYTSWRNALFAGGDALDDSISGPNADPDNDGLTNQQEFDAGSDPNTPTIAVSDPFSESVTTNSATLGGTVEADPYSTVGVTIIERGVVYSASSTNPFPAIDGPGVNRVPSPNVVVVSDAAVNLQTVTITVANHKLAVGTSAYANISGLLNTELNEFGELVEAETINGRFLVKSLDSNRLSYTVPGVVGIVDKTGELEPTWIVVAVTGLASGTQYSFQGYVMTYVGIFYSSPVSSFYTLAQPPVTLPTVTTPTTGTITHNSAVLGGDVTSDGNSPITERGVVYSISSANDNPFIGGSGVTKKLTTGTTGLFTVNATALVANTTYSFRAYAINAVGTSHTSTIGTFTTPPAPTAPILSSPTATNITSTSATLGGNVTATGGSAVLQRGIVFSLTATNANPIMGGTGVSAFAASTTGTGVFTANATNLVPGKSYSYKAYAINSIGTGYTTVGTFTTPATLATVSAPTITNLTSTSATLGANVTNDGSSAILERGFVYSATAVDSDPNVGDAGVIKLTTTGTTGVFSVNATGLSANTGYTFKPFARNAIGTAYGAPYAFFTTFPPLTVTSPTVSAVTVTTAILGGTVASDGATTVSGRGVVYSLNPNVAPVIGGPGVIQKTTTGSMGAFTVPVTGLSSATNYYFRAYATNTAGTSYSVVSTFKTETAALLGLAQMEWVPGPPPAQMQSFSVEDPLQPQSTAVESPQAVPGFVYYKAESEALNQMEIQISSDNREWLPINQDWTVTDDTTEIRATWGSTNTPPARIFFRVSSIIR
jgi:hypothetical protein